MAQTSSSSQEVHSEAQPNNKTQTHPHAADRALLPAGTDSSELQASDADQVTLRKASPEILPEKCLSKDKHQGPQYQGSFTKSLQKTDPFYEKRIGPNHKYLPRQKRDNSDWNYETEDNFVACQDLTSRSSQRLQHLEHTLLSLRSQCHVLHGSGGCLRGCITGLSTSGEVEFYYHPQAAAFSQHYAQLQHLLEQRARLLFLHEYGRRCRAANCFISRLGNVRGKSRLLSSRGQSSKEQAWNLDLRAKCEELQVHISHWDTLYARVRSDPFLRNVFVTHTEMLSSMQRVLELLGQQAFVLMENCMHTVLKALAAVQLVYVPRDALEDVLSAVELYNHVATNLRSQKKPAAWSLQIMFTSDCSPIRSGLPRKHVRRGTLLQLEIMKIVAQHRAHIAARQLYNWTCQQTDLLSLTGQTNKNWRDFDRLDLLIPPALDQSCSNKPLHRFWSSTLHLFVIAHRDEEDILKTLFQVLKSSTDLLASKRPHLIRSVSAERSCTTSRGEEITNPKMFSTRIQSSTRQIDPSNLDASAALFPQYRDMLRREFGRAVIDHFYYPSHSTVLGGMNQWNDQMVFLLLRWLKQACNEELVPAECKDALNEFCSHILSTSAFMHWDAIMCESLGLGVKDKCLPRATVESCTIRTATMEHALQLFPPLLSVLQLLQGPHTNTGDKRTRSFGLYHLGLLRRAVATVQSSTFWVVSKAYQFLASWSLTKFVLVTQGDLKAFRETVESLVQQLNIISTDHHHHHHHHHHHLIVEHGRQLSQAVSQLQTFSELVLRIFSMDCKKMSLEIFEQTMPAAKHWRVHYKTALPSTPSDYAAFAAESVLGQVLEGVQPLPDETRVTALAEAMTAFMEAWMEHILKQKIKFSVHGALQLKQDFDLIRELICSEKYSLPEELHHRLLSLRVFHQVDSAIVCLLQQPVSKPYMSSQRWEPFRHCCPNRAQVVDQAVGSLNNLETIDIQAACHQALTRAEGSVSPELLSTAPPESYLVMAQQEWLDLRMHTRSRWRIPGLRCFTTSEP